MDVRELSDRAALRELACSYARAVDRRDYASLVALFLPGGVLCGPGYELPGHAAIDAGIRLIERYARTQHCVHNERIALAGEEASGEVYCVAHHLYERAGVARKLDMGIRYQDRYRRTPDGWRIARRELVVDWEQDLPLAGELR